MAATMDSPNTTYPESPMDQEDVVYPCKGCGEILEEGKAFELAGNRWHIDCFRCNTCDTLLDSDANLLLLGDGSLICNNCTYSCSACHNKIEDLAILTGDQAFCSGCFRCRNCKRKIENLRYARTSQGIFCMSCHESLMARRRKKARTPKTTSGATPGIEKALPSLPPGVVPDSAFTPEDETPPVTYSETATKSQSRLSRDRQLGSRNEGTSTIRDVSPLSDDPRRGALNHIHEQQRDITTNTILDGPILPASTYNNSSSRYTTAGSLQDDDDDETGGDIPMVLDNTPIASPLVPSQAPPVQRKPVSRPQELSPPVQKENQPPRDYFGTNGRISAKPAPRDQLSRDALREDARSRSVSTEREQDRNAAQARPSPHILSQDKGRARKRDTSGGNTPVNGSAAASPIMPSTQDRGAIKQKAPPLSTDAQTLSQDTFRLQDVPRTAKARSRANSRQGAVSPQVVSSIDRHSREDHTHKPVSPVSVGSQNSGINPFDDPKRMRALQPSGETPVPPRNADRMLPLRGDSLAAAAAHRSKTSTPDPPTPTAVSSSTHINSRQSSQTSSHERNQSSSSVPSTFTDAQSTLSRDNSSRSKVEQPAVRSSLDAVVPPPRAASRPTAPSKSVANDDFIAPRHAPPPPVGHTRNNDSVSTMHSIDNRPSIDGQLSPALHSAGLPKYSLDGGFSMDDDLGRILRGEQAQDRNGPASPSVLRRVSNAVKHGRSFSDRAVPGGRSPRNGSLDISSPAHTPLITSPTGADGLDTLRSSLRRAQVHIAELEAEKVSLQEKLDGSTDMKAVNTELREKRSTMAFLDTQREMVVRELEIMTEHLSKAKDTSQPIDLGSLKTIILRDFAESLQKLKDNMGAQIEDLMHKRNELTDEIGNLIQMKDKGFQEYESLSSKNSQLLQHNNELIRSIQGMYQDNRQPNGALGGANGLGIYNPGAKLDTTGPTEVRNLNIVNTDSNMPTLLHDPESEPATMLTQPQVVNIRKGGKPTKFNWRRGGEKVAGKVTKGLKGALGGDRAPSNQGQYAIGHPYDSRQAVGGSDVSSVASKALSDESKAAGYGFFGQKNGGVKQGTGFGHLKNNSSTNLVDSSDGSVLFGSELSARCEFEGSMIPNIVMRCIAEVEKRGMDIEGIYRKSGGAGQVKTVQQGFEKDDQFDISDEDLDIHAITSAMKQYFRKLPTPLIVYESYEALLEAGQFQDKEKRANALRQAVNELPDAHRDCLQYLVGHLARVMAHESHNLMTPLNLAVVFAPTIMRPLSIEREMSDMQIQRHAVQALLENHKVIFSNDD
ncbi:Rho GTPase-activating protein 15 [Fulvia fulva]|nr:Rho GTPase-activating protein 15 [Fulvia fulva]WPV26122.1 Rho GTPase-activating protein 15 [Fulvia fulva]